MARNGPDNKYDYMGQGTPGYFCGTSGPFAGAGGFGSGVAGYGGFVNGGSAGRYGDYGSAAWGGYGAGPYGAGSYGHTGFMSGGVGPGTYGTQRAGGFSGLGTSASEAYDYYQQAGHAGGAPFYGHQFAHAGGMIQPPQHVLPTGSGNMLSPVEQYNEMPQQLSDPSRATGPATTDSPFSPDEPSQQDFSYPQTPQEPTRLEEARQQAASQVRRAGERAAVPQVSFPQQQQQQQPQQQRPQLQQQQQQQQTQVQPLRRPPQAEPAQRQPQAQPAQPSSRDKEKGATPIDYSDEGADFWRTPTLPVVQPSPQKAVPAARPNKPKMSRLEALRKQRAGVWRPGVSMDRGPAVQTGPGASGPSSPASKASPVKKQPTVYRPLCIDVPSESERSQRSAGARAAAGILRQNESAGARAAAGILRQNESAGARAAAGILRQNELPNRVVDEMPDDPLDLDLDMDDSLMALGFNTGVDMDQAAWQAARTSRQQSESMDLSMTGGNLAPREPPHHARVWKPPKVSRSQGVPQHPKEKQKRTKPKEVKGKEPKKKKNTKEAAIAAAAAPVQPQAQKELKQRAKPRMFRPPAAVLFYVPVRPRSGRPRRPRKFLANWRPGYAAQPAPQPTVGRPPKLRSITEIPSMGDRMQPMAPGKPSSAWRAAAKLAKQGKATSISSSKEGKLQKSQANLSDIQAAPKSESLKLKISLGRIDDKGRSAAPSRKSPGSSLKKQKRERDQSAAETDTDSDSEYDQSRRSESAEVYTSGNTSKKRRGESGEVLQPPSSTKTAKGMGKQRSGLSGQMPSFFDPGKRKSNAKKLSSFMQQSSKDKHGQYGDLQTASERGSTSKQQSEGSRKNTSAKKAASFQPGELIWAKLAGRPWWPGQIQTPVSAAHYASKHEGDDFFVVFYGDREYKWLPESYILPLHKAYEEHAAVKHKGLQAAIDAVWEAIGKPRPVLAPGEKPNPSLFTV